MIEFSLILSIKPIQEVFVYNAYKLFNLSDFSTILTTFTVYLTSFEELIFVIFMYLKLLKGLGYDAFTIHGITSVIIL